MNGQRAHPRSDRGRYVHRDPERLALVRAYIGGLLRKERIGDQTRQKVATVGDLEVDISIAVWQGHIADTPYANTQVRCAIDIAHHTQLLAALIVHHSLERQRSIAPGEQLNVFLIAWRGCGEDALKRCCNPHFCGGRLRPCAARPALKKKKTQNKGGGGPSPPRVCSFLWRGGT